MTPIQLVNFIQEDGEKLWHAQRCPFCNATDQRTPAQRYRDMRCRGNGTQGHALRDWVAAGLEILIDVEQYSSKPQER